MLTQTTLRPGQKGTKSLAEKYGDRLVCVRYKYDEKTGRRLATVELIEEETDFPTDQKPLKQHEPVSSQRRLGVKVEY